MSEPKIRKRLIDKYVSDVLASLERTIKKNDPKEFARLYSKLMQPDLKHFPFDKKFIGRRMEEDAYMYQTSNKLLAPLFLQLLEKQTDGFLIKARSCLKKKRTAWAYDFEFETAITIGMERLTKTVNEIVEEEKSEKYKKEVLDFMHVQFVILLSEKIHNALSLIRQGKKTRLLTPEYIRKMADDVGTVPQHLLELLRKEKHRSRSKLYSDDDFEEVDRLIRDKRYRAIAAIEEVAKNHRYNAAGFRQQYYDRYLQTIRNKK
jgi:hypothetical protein